MGNHAAVASQPTITLDTYIAEAGAQLQYERGMGKSRFLRTIRVREESSSAVLKIFAKGDPSVQFTNHIQYLHDLKNSLQTLPNVLPFEIISETDRAIYLRRQYLSSNLYDRVSTRPFLSVAEKKWIAFQLLQTLARIHALGIYHGDIKAENVLVTTWNWLYLSDFAAFKPTFLPEDDPADFSYFFDSSLRRTCYLAPERFCSGTERPATTPNAGIDGLLTAAMDIFSLGCVLAELFLEGVPIFTFSQLLLYRKGEYDPAGELLGVVDDDVREMIQSMISLHPENRLSAAEYLTKWNATFPSFYDGFLYRYLASLCDRSVSVTSAMNVQQNETETDAKIQRISQDFGSIILATGLRKKTDIFGSSPFSPEIPPSLKAYNVVEGIEILMSVVTSCVRNSAAPSTKLKAVNVLHSLAFHVNDELKLDRIIPYLISLLSDGSSLVRSVSIRILSQLLGSIDELPPTDMNIVSEYVFPNLLGLTNDPSIGTRLAYAECFADLAETAHRFLELSQLNGGNEDTDVESGGTITFDERTREFHECIESQLSLLLHDRQSIVRRTLLAGLSRFCFLLGRRKSKDFLLSHIITFLNDKDWQVRSEFFENIVGVAAFLGSKSLEQFILPVLFQALRDHEETVVEKVLRAMCSLSELGLFLKNQTRRLVVAVAPFLSHPNTWIRANAIDFLVVVCKNLSTLDIHCLVLPALPPQIKTPIALIEKAILDGGSSSATTRPIVSEVSRSWEPEDHGTFLISDGCMKLHIMPKTVFLSPPWTRGKLQYGRQGPKQAPRGAVIQVGDTKTDTYNDNVDKVSSIAGKSRKASASLSATITTVSVAAVPDMATNQYLRENDPEDTSSRDGMMLKDTEEQYFAKKVGSIFPRVSIELGPRVTPPTNLRGRTSTTSRATIFSPVQTWKPKGLLISNFTEHTGAVTRLAISTDNSFFVSGSSDGTLKIWDCLRVEKNVTNRSRGTYRLAGSIEAVCFCLDTHCIAVADATGTVDIVRVEYSVSNGGTHYGKNNSVSSLKFAGERVTDLTHYAPDSQSVLIVSTESGVINGWDLRTDKPSWKLKSPREHGAITALTSGGQPWIVSGTHRGVLAMWDIRFQIPVQSWLHPSRSPINRLWSRPDTGITRDAKHVFCSAGDNQISVWDVEQAACRELFCGHTLTERPTMKDLQALPIGGLRDAHSFPVSAPQTHRMSACVSAKDCNFLITGGSDRRLRFWDMGDPQRSYSVSDPVMRIGEPQLQFGSYRSDGILIHYETRPTTMSKQNARVDSTSWDIRRSPSFGKSETISHHQDTITDLLISEVPYPLLISSSRDSTIKVWK